jgi:hypothetical protein
MLPLSVVIGMLCSTNFTLCLCSLSIFWNVNTTLAMPITFAQEYSRFCLLDGSLHRDDGAFGVPSGCFKYSLASRLKDYVPRDVNYVSVPVWWI